MRYKLTDAKLRAIKPNGKLQKITDGGGLSVRVSPTGTKTFSYAYRAPNGLERAISFDNYPDKTLAKAREEHQAARQLLAEGICPATRKKEEAERLKRERRTGDGTFMAFASQWIKHNEERWAPKYLARVKGLLEGNKGNKNGIYKIIGTRKIKDVKPADVREIMLMKTADGPTAAAKAKQVIKEVYDFCISNLHAETNPTTGLKNDLIIGKHVATSHKDMTELELGAFFRALTALEDGETQPSSINCAKFLTLTGVRKQEARLAEWSEFADLDGDEPTWTVPAAKMKMREEHQVPLSTQAVEVLKAQREITGGRQYVFASATKATPLASCTLNAMFTRLKGIRSDLTVHATRATITTILGNHDFDEELLDLILAHGKEGSKKPYMNQKKVAQRRVAMQYYADLCDKVAAGANVVPLVRRKRAAAA